MLFHFWDLPKSERRISSPKLVLELELVKVMKLVTGTGTGDGFSPGSKPRGTIILILI